MLLQGRNSFYARRLILNLKSNSSDILRWDMGVMVARSYVLQLSDNVKRSKEESLKRGICIGRAPIGYLRILDEKGDKTLIPDPAIKPIIQEMFEQYATGNHSLQSLTLFMKERGLRTINGNPVVKSQIESMLKIHFMLV